ncbi:motility associated factor glycosyltransferase family protein [Clostridium botulinum]|uniref:motility associated factor glycosyltransferase family protein n=1 Tax=Clostridium botulinum TaxID=1491 RepID=UPI00077463BE|nr:6-hydroxymethylpterin diphosphokinase MptE-like protein [Clostridium botulinum]MBY6811899.1 motility associated factor glycosyltransferase family protein [Clostridium botulinum]MBY6825381.1 motility associated factor glycosyltransferase family protein [Clostridium botulinum]MBY6835726.1 motility associated factor glycosyltransferase family protein [Clostridium botulinum]MBY6974415.1 motility associated factor glycosyltransferase family protein [Clostridium botulinum]NFH78566.1 motility asso
MKKIRSLDGYNLYEIEKDNVKFCLADNINYKKDIQKLINNLEDLRFDSFIILFGLDTGEYIKELQTLLCERNRVIIFEPNQEVIDENKNIVLGENISLILFDKKIITPILSSIIDCDNFDNLYFYSFGNYKEIYKDEYEKLKEEIDSIYFSITGNITLAYRCKESFMRNSIQNLKVIKESSPLNSYANLNQNIPGIVVSAGPSLDKNIQDMVKNKEKLKQCFIISSNRTFTVLIQNGIKPDLVVSIDPSDAMYDMMKNNLNENIPLLYYEYSNRYLLKEYKGEKIYISNVFSNLIEEMSRFKGLSQGGSVAHTCLSMANLLGCNPIILVGQDLAYTYDKHHSEKATFNFVDEGMKESWADKVVDDVFGNKVKTTTTLKVFKDSMEYHIEQYKNSRKVEFINASYGADIKGAPHQELSQIFKTKIFNNNKKSLNPNKCINLDDDKIIKSIINFVESYIEKSEQGIEQCTILSEVDEDKSLINTDENDIDFQRFLFIFDIVENFENSLENFYLGGYFNKFMFAIKRESFSMFAKDYERLTSNMKYQGKAFLNYFKRMNEMLLEAKKIIDEEVSNL